MMYSVRKLTRAEQEELLKQIEAEYNFAKDALVDKFNLWNKRLELFTHQKYLLENAKRGKIPAKDVRFKDHLMFSIFYTIFPPIYADRMNVKFVPRDEGDAEVAETYNQLAEYDYDLVDMASIEYDMAWNAMFFGHSILALKTFDRKKLKAPIPEVYNPMTFLHDPLAVSINGDINGKGRARFFGRLVLVTANDLYNKLNELQNIGTPEAPDLPALRDVQNDEKLTKMLEGLEKQREAMGDTINILQQDVEFGYNKQYVLIEWYTFYKGKRVEVVTTPSFDRILKYVEINLDFFPFVDRFFYKMSNRWDGISIPDLVEDAQRNRSRLMTLLYQLQYQGLRPRYLFMENAIVDKQALMDWRNDFVPVRGNPEAAVVPMHKAQANIGVVGWLMNLLDEGSQRATATPEIKQGVVSRRRRTLGEITQAITLSDDRYSLIAKLFAQSTKKYYQLYLMHYKYFFTNKDKKLLRIKGADTIRWKVLTKDNLTFRVDPDVNVESTVIAEIKRRQKLSEMMGFLSLALQAPGANARYIIKKVGELSGLKQDELRYMFPATPDESKALLENESLSKGELVKIDATDDDIVHIIEHRKAKQTPATIAHIEAHVQAYYMKQKQKLMQEDQGAQNPILSLMQQQAQNEVQPQGQQVEGGLAPEVQDLAETIATPPAPPSRPEALTKKQ